MNLFDRRRAIITSQINNNVIYEAKNIVLTGSNYIDTGFNAFSAENINKDFKITIRISQMKTGGEASAIIGNKYEGSLNGVSYPGFYFRFKGKEANNVQVATSGTWQTTYSLSSVLNKTLYIWRTNKKIYNQLENGKIYNMTLNSTIFNQNMIIGAAIRANGTIFRYVSGVVDYVRIEYI